MQSSELAVLLSKVRQGDDAAAAEIVRLYEPEVRRFIRFRLSSPSLRRMIDSLDICQSVLANFFVRITNGEMLPCDSRSLQALLLTMARNRLLDHVRFNRASKRDVRRTAAGMEGLEFVTDPGKSPSNEVIAEELVRAIRAQLAPEDLQLVEARFSGRDWNSLTADFGGTPESLRKRVSRAMDNAAKSLGFVDEMP
jgi:DNA-directed RNA polymerase specialized sigma24 family protein